MLTTYVNVICCHGRPLKDGTFPIVLRLSCNGKRKQISLGMSVDGKYWDFARSCPKRNCPDRDVILTVMERKKAAYRAQINEYRIENKDYTLDSLVDRVENPIKRRPFGDYIDEKIAMLGSEGRLGYRKCFVELRSSVMKWRGSLDFYFSDIDVPWLKAYEAYLRNRGNRSNTLGIRFRTLRTLYNQAVVDKVVKRDYYPFYDFRPGQFWERTRKRAITKDDIKSIINLDMKTITTYYSPYLEFARDLFLFSYVSCGMNFTDIARLTYADISGGRVSYFRKKTGKRISFQLQPLAVDIIEKYRRNGHAESDYVFPILDRRFHKTEIQKRDRLHRALGATNRALHKIGDKLGLQYCLTTYVARHSYATVLKRSGVPTSIISESLGHSSERITQIYLDSFENSQIDNALKHLL